ncbi:MAG: hypothetical protein PVJ22_21170 [Desulfobacterales bacterium]|jgi:hypothetical protein
MGLSIRVFIVEDDDTIKRLPLARYERLLNRDPDERLSRYAGQRVRYALIVVNLVNRKPIEVVKDEYAYLDFDKRVGLKNRYMKKWRVLRLICSISFPLNKKRIGGS